MRIAKAAGIITVGFSLSRVLGYIRLKALSYVFGANAFTDAYVAAFRVPDLFYFLLGGGALSAAFIPVFTDVLKKKDKDEALELFWTVALVLSGATFLAVLLLELLMPLFVKAVFPTFDAVRYELTVRYSRILAPMLIFTVLSGVMTAACQSYKRFAYPAFAYIFYNIPIIIATFWLGERFGIPALCGGVLLGAFLLFAVQSPVIVQETLFKIRFSLHSAAVKKVLSLFLPAMAGIALSQVNLFLVPTIFAAKLRPGIVTDVEYATRLILLPLGIFGMALSQAIFPFLSEKAGGEGDSFRKTLNRGMLSTLFFSIPSFLFILLYGRPIVVLLFSGGAFGKEQVEITQKILMLLSLGLLPLLALQVTVRGFHAYKDTTTPVVTGIFSLLSNILLCSFLLQRLDYLGIALAASLAQWVNLFLHLGLLLRRKHLSLEWLSGGRILIASALAGLLTFFFASFLPHLQANTPYAVLPSLFMITFLFGLLYLGVGFCLGIPETKEIVRIVSLRGK